MTYVSRTPTGTDKREWRVLLGAPDQIDEFGRRLHHVTLKELEEHDGLDRSLVASGLVLHHRIPWGPDGGTVLFAEAPAVAPVPSAPERRGRMTIAELNARRFAKRAGVSRAD